MSKPAQTRKAVTEGGAKLAVVGKRAFLTRHSSTAAVWAILYALPFWDSRKEEICAACVLYRAVVQNSRKWKRDSTAKKKGRRQSVECVRRRRAMARISEDDRTKPRSNARVAMPERDLARPG
jgi:hypothetical protein